MNPSLRRSGIPFSLFAVALVVWASLLFTSSRSTFWDRDEARYATASLEMSQSGNWQYPTFNHELRAFQPAMIYWLMGASLHAFGPGEVSVRLVSTVAIALVCLMTGLIARQFFGAGTLAAAVAGTSPMLLLTGTAATTDATLLLFILVAEGVFVHAWLNGPRRWNVPVMGVAIGLAMLTKGPVGLVVPVLSIVTALLLARGRSHAGPFGLKLLAAVGVGFLLFLAWGIPANAATGGEYWRIAIVERLPKRLFTAMENHGGQGILPFLLHLPYYPLVLAAGFLPWTMYLPMAGGAFKQPGPGKSDCWARGPEGFRTLLLGMTLPTILLMTVVVSKLPHYIQPVLPWLAILMASGLVAHRDETEMLKAKRRMRASFLVFGIPAVCFGVALIVAPWVLPPASAFRVAGGVIGLLTLGLLPLLGFLIWRGKILMAAKIHAVAVMVFLLAGGLFVLPVLEQIAKPAQNLAREVHSQLPDDAVVATYGWREPGMHFYLGARRLHFLHDPKSLENWLLEPGPKALILNEGEAGALDLPPVGFRQIATQTGWNVVNGQQIRLSAFLRE